MFVIFLYASTHSCGGWFDITFFLPLIMITAALNYSFLYIVFITLSSFDATPEILSLVFYLSILSSYSIPTLIRFPLNTIITLPCFEFFSTSAHFFCRTIFKFHVPLINFCPLKKNVPLCDFFKRLMLSQYSP